MSWEERHVYTMLGPAKTWPLCAALFVCPPHPPTITCGSSPRLSSGTSATCSLSLSLPLSLPLESRDLNPSPGFDYHRYISPRPGAKFTIFLPESACPPSRWPHFSPCTITLLQGQLQIPASFLNLSPSLLHQSAPKLQPISHSTSHHVIPGHCYMLLTDITGIIFGDINSPLHPPIPFFPLCPSPIQT